MTTTTAGHNISAPEAARRLGISVRTLDRMEKDNRLKPASRIGGRRKYDAAAVERVRTGGTA
jgi:excisionase family DNA binding protein